MARKPILSVRVDESKRLPALFGLCAGYEVGTWRSKALARDLFHSHLLSFALSWSEVASVDADSAPDDIVRAARLVYTTDNYKRRGEFGELLLHAVVRDFFDAQTAICKIYFKTTPNETVKGFDSVHVVASEDGALELWLGEVKFYDDAKRAIRDVIKELGTHLSPDYLKQEFTLITNKLDPAWPHSEALKELLHANTSLDEVLDVLTVPVLLTYDSQAVGAHTAVNDSYKAALAAEVTAAWDYWVERYDVDVNVRLHLILVPLENKAEFARHLHERLVKWRDD